MYHQQLLPTIPFSRSRALLDAACQNLPLPIDCTIGASQNENTDQLPVSLDFEELKFTTVFSPTLATCQCTIAHLFCTTLHWENAIVTKSHHTKCNIKSCIDVSHWTIYTLWLQITLLLNYKEGIAVGRGPVFNGAGRPLVSATLSSRQTYITANTCYVKYNVSCNKGNMLCMMI